MLKVVLAHVSACNAFKFFSRIFRNEALVYKSFFFSEEPFFGNCSTLLDSHTNNVISRAFAYSSTLCTRGFFSRATGSFVSADDTSGDTAGHFLRLGRNRKPRMKILWHPGYYSPRWIPKRRQGL